MIEGRDVRCGRHIGAQCAGDMQRPVLCVRRLTQDLERPARRARGGRRDNRLQRVHFPGRHGERDVDGDFQQGRFRHAQRVCGSEAHLQKGRRGQNGLCKYAVVAQIVGRLLAQRTLELRLLERRTQPAAKQRVAVRGRRRRRAASPWQGRYPAALALKGIGWQAHLTARYVAAKGSPVDDRSMGVEGSDAFAHLRQLVAPLAQGGKPKALDRAAGRLCRHGHAAQDGVRANFDADEVWRACECLKALYKAHGLARVASPIGGLRNLVARWLTGEIGDKAHARRVMGEARGGRLQLFQHGVKQRRVKCV